MIILCGFKKKPLPSIFLKGLLWTKCTSHFWTVKIKASFQKHMWIQAGLGLQHYSPCLSFFFFYFAFLFFGFWTTIDSSKRKILLVRANAAHMNVQNEGKERKTKQTCVFPKTENQITISPSLLSQSHPLNTLKHPLTPTSNTTQTTHTHTHTHHHHTSHSLPLLCVLLSWGGTSCCPWHSPSAAATAGIAGPARRGSATSCRRRPAHPSRQRGGTGRRGTEGSRFRRQSRCLWMEREEGNEGIGWASEWVSEWE